MSEGSQLIEHESVVAPRATRLVYAYFPASDKFTSRRFSARVRLLTERISAVSAAFASVTVSKRELGHPYLMHFSLNCVYQLTYSANY